MSTLTPFLYTDTFSFEISIPDNDGYDFMRIDNIAISVFGSSNYETWAAGYGLYGPSASTAFDLEPDGMGNFMEYVLGGNPTNADAAAVLPTFGIVPDLGTDWLQYVYRRRSDYLARGLVYTVQTTTNLVSNDWNTNGVIPAGFAPLDPDFDSVTNRVSTEEKPEQFIRLLVE